MSEEDIEFQEYEKFAQRMEKSYPQMYPGQYGGFAVGKGWYPIIERLSSSIQQHIEFKNKQGEVCPQVVVQQVKEKFGGLRFYYDGGDDYIHGLVSMAESWAGIACETCGGIGKRRGGGWIKTLCDIHYEESEKRKEEYAKKNGLEL
jgi:hypothetical protein